MPLNSRLHPDPLTSPSELQQSRPPRQEDDAQGASSDEDYQPPHVPFNHDDGDEEIQRTSSVSSSAEQQQLQEPETLKKSRNIFYTLVFTGFAFAGRSIWQQSVLATYVYLLMQGNAESVGFITAVMGIMQLVASIPTGYIVDRHRRDIMLKVASGFGWVAVTVTMWALYQEHFPMLVVALATWGILWGIANTALGALFADSVPEGERAYYFSLQSILRSFGNMSGPIVALLVFFVLGDTWTLKDCAVVMAVGQCVSFPAIVVLAWFSDDDGVVASSSRRHQSSVDDDDDRNALTEPLLRERNISGDEESGLFSMTGNEQEGKINIVSHVSSCYHGNDDNCDNRTVSSTTGSASSTSSLMEEEDHEEYFYGCIPRHRLAPILIAAGDMTSGLAAGMSIRYFPIFFVDSLKLSPVAVQMLYIVSPLLQALLTNTSQRLSERFGRCQMALLHKWIGISCMVGLIVGFQMGLPREWICLMFVLRTAFMNSISALTTSILMDNVPTHERGRWTVLESVNMFSWSGSAALGGLFVSFGGILFNFWVTATLQFIASLPVLALMLTIDVDNFDVEVDESRSEMVDASSHNCGTQRTMPATDSSASDEEDEMSSGYRSP